MKIKHVLMVLVSVLVLLLAACAPEDLQPSAMPAVSTTSSQQPAVSASPISSFKVELLHGEITIVNGNSSHDTFKITSFVNGTYNVTPSIVEVTCQNPGYSSKQVRTDIHWETQSFELLGSSSHEFGIFVEEGTPPARCEFRGRMIVKDSNWQQVWESQELVVIVHIQ